MESNESQLFCNKCNENYMPHDVVTCIKYDFYQCNSCGQIAFNCSICQKMVIYHRIRSYERHITSLLHTGSSGYKLPNNDDISESIEFSNSDIFVKIKLARFHPLLTIYLIYVSSQTMSKDFSCMNHYVWGMVSKP